MTEKFLNFFDGWSQKNKFYLVTGSDISKMEEQIPDIIMEKKGLFFKIVKVRRHLI